MSSRASAQSARDPGPILVPLRRRVALPRRQRKARLIAGVGYSAWGVVFAFGRRWANAFRAEALASLPFCRSDSISEGVSISAAEDVAGFGGGEAGGVDLEEFADGIPVPRFDEARHR
jgi:hypothetical protein